MEHLIQYQTVINSISIDDKARPMNSSIQSVLLKTNSKLKHLTKLIFPYDKTDFLVLESNKPRRSKYRNTIRKRIQIHCYLDANKNKTSIELQGNNSNRTTTNNNNNKHTVSHLPLTAIKPYTRNKAYLSSSLYKDYSTISNKTQNIQASFTKTTAMTQGNTATKQKRKEGPRVCLYYSDAKLNQNTPYNQYHNPYSTNKTLEALMSTLPSPSPNPFSLTDTPNPNSQSLNKSKAPLLQCYKDNASFSSKLLKRKCEVIESKCHSVDKAVKRFPLRKYRNKKKIQQLLNESNETINDLSDSKPIKEEKDHMINISIKTKQVLRETDWIHRMNPDLALDANKTLRKMFSIQPNKRYKEDSLCSKKSQMKFQSKINAMSDLLNKNLKANKKCSDYFSKLHKGKVQVESKQKPKADIKNTILHHDNDNYNNAI